MIIMKKLMVLLIVICAIAACKKEKEDIIQLQGSWIEISQLKDSFVFDNSDFEGMVILHREKVLSNGQLIPKMGDGTYNYSIQNNTIEIVYGLSSCHCSSMYHFYFDESEGKLIIGNFYDGTKDINEPIEFRKL